MFSTKPNLRDGLVALVVLFFALLLLFLPMLVRSEGKTLVITTADSTKEYDLSISRTLEIESNGHHLTIVIENGAAYVSDTDCKDKVCLHTGKIRESGEVILCVPAGVRILVKGGKSNVDFVAG
ncbi:MAG: NusG domain II-containing protein [Clostridia bacterium]|nr:NusG domain II-containing protein [Clostridia bacterium]